VKRREAEAHGRAAKKRGRVYEATQNAPPLAAELNESESESKFENGAKRLCCSRQGYLLFVSRRAVIAVASFSIDRYFE
jgi:hypothetical protein